MTESEQREYDRAVREREQADKGERLADEIANALNFMSGNEPFEKAFVEKITRRTHPTLQQGTAQLFLAVFKRWAEIGDEGRYDLRNEDTIEAAKKIREALKEHYFRFI